MTRVLTDSEVTEIIGKLDVIVKTSNWIRDNYTLVPTAFLDEQIRKITEIMLILESS